jgi:hypothetical protein
VRTVADGRIKRSQAQERRTARKFAGQRQPASGAFDTAKNDVRSERYLIENKRSDNLKSIRIMLEDVDALGLNAGLIGREPVMHIEIAGRHLVLCEEWVWDNRVAEA